jgi:subtilisin family serine protease
MLFLVLLSSVMSLAQAEQGLETAYELGDMSHRFAAGEILVKFKSAPSMEARYYGSSRAPVLRGAAAENLAAAFPLEVQRSLDVVQGKITRAHIETGLLQVRLSSGIAVGRAIESLYASGTVEYAEPNYRIKMLALPKDPKFAEQWALNNTGQSGGTTDADIDAPQAWDVRTDGSQAVVALIDSGVDYKDPDLAANMWKNPGEISGDGIDNDDNGWIDDV